MSPARFALFTFATSLTIASCSKKPDPYATETQPILEQPTAPPRASGSGAPGGPVHPVDELQLPVGLGPMPIPKDNPQTPAKVRLGHQLFFETRLSVDGTRACYSCHQNEDGNGGHEPLAIGAKNEDVGMHSPVIWNVGYLQGYYWDGRSATLEEQATAAWAGANMGVGKEGLTDKAKEIEGIAGYKRQFAEAFPGVGVTPGTIVQAIAAYERTLVCDQTRYDRWAAGDKAALSKKAKDGLALFLGKAGCSACHSPPHFSIAYSVPSGAYFNVGIGMQGAEAAAESARVLGRFRVTKNAEDWGAFKPPTLRNVARSGPYFHDGSVKTLEEAVRYMASGGYQNKNLSPLMTDRKLTGAEVGEIVAFLEALDCGKKLEKPGLPR